MSIVNLSCSMAVKVTVHDDVYIDPESSWRQGLGLVVCSGDRAGRLPQWAVELSESTLYLIPSVQSSPFLLALWNSRGGHQWPRRGSKKEVRNVRRCGAALSVGVVDGHGAMDFAVGGLLSESVLSVSVRVRDGVD